uniref:C2H2-type domain-containing protein n=1 Tax=Syphacia muris TaxID=451379 RepID=A0A158R409_9BILA
MVVDNIIASVKYLMDVHKKLMKDERKAEMPLDESSDQDRICLLVSDVRRNYVPLGHLIQILDEGKKANDQKLAPEKSNLKKEDESAEMDTVPTDQYEFLLDFFRSLEQRRDDVKTQQEQEKIGKNSAQNQSKFGSQLQPKSPITGKSNSFSTENISNNQRKKSSRKLDVYKENDESVSDEEGYNISPSTSKSFFNNDYSAPNIFFDDFTYSDLDEEFIFNELKAIDELLAQSPNATKHNKRPENTATSTKNFYEKPPAKKDRSKRMSQIIKTQNAAANILNDLEEYLNNEAVDDSSDTQSLSDEMLPTQLEGPLHNIEEEENYLPVKVKTTRRQQVVIKPPQPTKMITGITFMKPSSRKSSKELNSGKVACQFCGEYYYLGPGMSSHIRWKHRNLAIQTCPHCSDTFQDYDEFVEHIEQCSQKFANTSIHSRRQIVVG